ncbi:hypothetical protein MVEN_00277600 [Mycena venus]|uniref:Uncharacterized protein n=1 Tax=Mycena venus TaxID=2733690 RepID=A0A8H6Z214_9AGAR|nr:hypothetical protein MVEN_00277600 [Mycena venus]
MDSHSPPVFPTELEREIFKIAARSYPQSIPKFIVVAWRVKLWVEPLLYRTIIFIEPENAHMKSQIMPRVPIHSRDTLSPILQYKGQPFFADATRNLLIHIKEIGDAELVFSHCRGIENLWLFVPPSTGSRILSQLADLPLKQFHGSVVQLFGSPEQIDFSHRFFSQITHLSLLDNTMETLSSFFLLPNLTHLSVDAFLAGEFHTVLQTCPWLRVFVATEMIRMPPIIDNYPERDVFAKDPRFVVIDYDLTAGLRDWQMGTYSGNDFWSRAEDFVARRRSGEVDISQYRLD